MRGTIHLLEGDVGTGKTSVLMRTFHRYVAEHPDARVLGIFLAPIVVAAQDRSHFIGYDVVVQPLDIRIPVMRDEAHQHHLLGTTTRLRAKDKRIGQIFIDALVPDQLADLIGELASDGLEAFFFDELGPVLFSAGDTTGDPVTPLVAAVEKAVIRTEHFVALTRRPGSRALGIAALLRLFNGETAASNRCTKHLVHGTNQRLLSRTFGWATRVHSVGS